MRRKMKKIAAICTALTMLIPASPVLADQTITTPSTATVTIGATVDSSYTVTLPTAVPAASFSKDTGATPLPGGTEAAYVATFTASANGNIPMEKRVTLSLTDEAGVSGGTNSMNFLLYKDGVTTSPDVLTGRISFFGNSFTSPSVAQKSCEWRSGIVDVSSVADAENLGTDVTAYVHYFTAHKAGTYSRNLSFTIGYEDVT